MGLEFYFEYDALDKAAFEVERQGGEEFAEVVECRESFKRYANLWPSFVAEYRAARATTLEMYADPDFEVSADPVEPDYTGETDTWGPSQPFDGAVLQLWAQDWISYLRSISDEQGKAIFPFGSYMHSSGGREIMVRSLQRLSDQAECASQHNVKLRMVMG